MDDPKRAFVRRVATSLVFLSAVIVMLTAVSVTDLFAQEAEPANRPMTTEEADVARWGFIAAAVAFGFGALGAGIGISNVGAAAMGAISEKPEIAGQALIFIALAEGLVVFGFITALIILGRI